MSAVEIWAPSDTRAFIILGDSITDGHGSDDDHNNRYVHSLPITSPPHNSHLTAPTDGPTSSSTACTPKTSPTSP